MKTIVAFSTIPSRVGHIRPTLRSLELQTHKPDLIQINIPQISTRQNTAYDVDRLETIIKQELHDCKGVVNIVDQDYGPLTKLMGSLLANELDDDHDTLIITIDDDQVYCPDFVERLHDKSMQYPKHVVCLCGVSIGKAPFSYGLRFSRQMNYPFCNVYYLKPDSPVDFVFGYGGVAYRRSFFSKQVFDSDLEDARATIPEIHSNDDHYISAWLDRLQVPRIVVDYGKDTIKRYGRSPDVTSSANDIDPLFRSSEQKSGHVSRIRHLMEWHGLIVKMRKMHLGFMNPVKIYKPLTCSLGGIGIVVATTAVVAATAITTYTIVKKKHA